jgi:hypothetical protein
MSLDLLLLLLVAAGATAMAIWSLRSRDGMYQFPFLASAVYIGWILPPAIGLCNNTSIPDGSYAAMMFMALLCLIAIFAAQEMPLKPRPVRPLEYDEKALMLGSAGLTVFGAFFAFMISSLPPEALVGQWSGPATIYLFLAHAQYYGFAIALSLLLRNFTWPLCLIAVFNLYFFLAAIVIGGRRGVTMEVGLIILTALWFERRIVLRRWQMLIAVVIGTLAFNSIGMYRALVFENSQLGYGSNEWRLPTLDRVLSLDYLGTLSSFAESGSEELRNAAVFISAKIESGNYNLGAGYWNDLVFHYVPGQLVGFDLKSSIMFQPDNDAYNVYFYEAQLGMTSTGLYDSFAAFGYFGALAFFLIGIMLRRYYTLSMVGDFRAKLLYGLLISTAMESITHSTSWFFSYMPQVFLFVLPVLAMAQARSKQIRNTQAYPRNSARDAVYSGRPRMGRLP